MGPVLAGLFALAAADAPVRPGPGEAAPAFSAAATTGKPIALSDFRGKKSVVLAFFPKAFTAG
jgi:peroxiredoxin